MKKRDSKRGRKKTQQMDNKPQENQENHHEKIDINSCKIRLDFNQISAPTPLAAPEISQPGSLENDVTLKQVEKQTV